MTINSRSAKLSSPNVKVQDVPNKPTIGTASVNVDTVQVPFTPATTGGRAAIYRAVSSPGGIEAISYGSSPITIPNLDDGVARTFTVRGETSTGATAGFSAASNSVSVPRSAMEFIATGTITPAANTNQIQFANIPQTYQDLLLVFSFRSTASATYDGLYFYSNNATTNGFSGTILAGNGSSASSTRSTNDQYGAYQGLVAGASATAGVFSTGTVHILNYANTTTNKTYITRIASDLNGSGQTTLAVGLARGTGAITIVTPFVYSLGNLAVGSTATLYGIRAVR